MVFGAVLTSCLAFQTPRRFTSVGFSTRINAAKISLINRPQTMAALEPVFISISSFYQTHMKSKMIVVGNILASILIQLFPLALLYCLYQSIMFVVSLGKKNDEVDKPKLTSNIIEVGDSGVGTTANGDQSNRVKTEQLLTDEKDRAVRTKQAKINAESDIRRITEEEAREYKLKLEKEARKKEEAYKQQARLLRFKQQRAAEKAGQYTYSTPMGKTTTSIYCVVYHLFLS